ncbi:hypothetical protein PENTCL1PPCAC_11976, partial [Pristionchus entomophagus]
LSPTTFSFLPCDVMPVFLLLLLSTNLVLSLNTHALIHPNESLNPSNISENEDYFNIVIGGVTRRCYWDGTAPACAGECPSTHDEMDRRDHLWTDPDCTEWKAWPWNCESDPHFGAPCLRIGPFWDPDHPWWHTTKALCCWKIKQ